MRAQRGILLKFPLLTRLYFLSADFEERFFKEPAGAAGIPFARGASPCKATELVLPYLAGRGNGACASNQRADIATWHKRPSVGREVLCFPSYSLIAV